jgi:hypothetical protein
MQRRSPSILILATLALGACSDSTNPAAERRIEGTYRATTFAVVTRDTVFNQLTERTS